MRQQRYILSAILLFFFLFLGIRFFIKIQDGKTQKPNVVVIDPGLNVRKMPASEEQGKQLYLNNCGACHASFDKQDGSWLTMPGLKDRWPDKSELIAFVKKSNDDKLKSNNRIKEIHNERPKRSKEYHDFPNLTDDQIKLMLDYIFWEIGSEKY